MRRVLKISKDLSLPEDAATQMFALFGMRGVGKTNAATVLCEEFLRAHIPFAVLDPTGAWWGLRASADGKSEGYPVMIIGGRHADAPLEETAGKIIADMLVEEPTPLVIDLSLMSKRAMCRFVAEFAERLYRKNQDPLHLVVDEADIFAPQQVRPHTAPVLGAMDEIGRRGRIKGLGCTFVTQRSAKINKDLVSQAEFLCVLRTAHPRDRQPVIEWMQDNATPEQIQEVKRTLAQLPIGDAWVMSAGWLELFKRIHIRERHTFNSSATPKVGKKRKHPRGFVRIDPKLLQKRLGAAIKRQEESDPKVLRRRITDLEKKLKAAEFAPAPEPQVKTVEIAVLPEADLKRFEAATVEAKTAMMAAQADFEAVVGAHKKALDAAMGTIRETAANVKQRPPEPRRPVAPRPAATPAPQTAATVVETPPEVADGVTINEGATKILTAIAQCDGTAMQEQIAVLTKYKATSRREYVRQLKAVGYIEGNGKGPFVATAAGVAFLGPAFEPLPTGPELLEYWRANLKKGELAMLNAIVEAYPEAVNRAVIEEKTDYKATSIREYVRQLKARKLVEDAGEPGYYRAVDMLF